MSKFRLGLALTAVVLGAVAVGGLLVAHHQHGAARHARATTKNVLGTNASAFDTLLAADAGVPVRRLLPGGSDAQFFVSELWDYLHSDARAMIALRLPPIPPLGRARTLAATGQQLAALRSRYTQVSDARITAGRQLVDAAQ